MTTTAWRILPIVTILAVLIPYWALAADRVALLIGNSEYERPELVLRNPENDVRALGAVLAQQGFQIIAAIDKDAEGMRSALAEFGERALNAEMALFFYAGHGIQMAGENLLVGVDFNGRDISDLEANSITMTEVREAMERARPEVGMIILDACRNTPFSTAGLTVPGLVRVGGGAGLIIAYSTDPGNVAFDGEGRNSVFTKALLDNIATPGLDVRLMLGRVRQEVVIATGGQQVPWVEEALLGEHVISRETVTAAPSDSVAEEVRRWRLIAGSASPPAFETYLADYPEGMFVDMAEERIRMLTASAGPDGLQNEAAMVLAAADPDRVAAALVSLGLLADDSTLTRSTEIDLGTAFSRYGAQLPQGEAVSLQRLFDDATRSSMVIAAATAQRIRTDLVALRSVDRALSIARTALAQIEEIATRNPAALPVLEQGRADLAGIEQSRATILARLDQSRTYYDELLARAVTFVPETASVSLLTNAPASRDLGRPDDRIRQDAALFLSQVKGTTADTAGSYAWLADFLATE